MLKKTVSIATAMSMIGCSAVPSHQALPEQGAKNYHINKNSFLKVLGYTETGVVADYYIEYEGPAPKEINLKNGTTSLARSSREKLQIDCDKWSLKGLGGQFFTEANFRGSTITINPGDWVNLPVGTRGAVVVEKACADFSVAQTTPAATPEPSDYSGPTAGEVVEVVGTVLGIAAIVGLAVLGVKSASKSSSSSSKPVSPAPVPTLAPAAPLNKIEPVKYQAPDIKPVKPPIPDLETVKPYKYNPWTGKYGDR